MIVETILTTRSPEGEPHVAPMGATPIEGGYLLQPFRPSRTLENLAATRVGVVNLTDDVRLFAAAVAGRRRPVAMLPGSVVDCPRLVDALAHEEIEVERFEDHPQRPKFFCRVRHAESHGRFAGMNRAKAAVLEAAVLVSRLTMLPDEKIDHEMTYLTIAVDKTAGPHEQEAFGWLVEAIAEHRRKRAS